MAAPVLTSAEPDQGRENAEVTLKGSGFGARTPDSGVRFRVPGSTALTGAVLDWGADSVRATVPSLASFGGGGPLEVLAVNRDGASNELPFTLLEDGPPAISSVAPTRGLEGQELTISGSRFGRQSAASQVLFGVLGPVAGSSGTLNQPPLVNAEVLSWGAAQVRVKVPTLEALGGAGQRPIVVRTPWGDSDAQPFLVGQLPTIDGFNPDDPRPGGDVVIHGQAFGATPGQLTLLPIFEEGAHEPGSVYEVPPHIMSRYITSWRDQEIVLVLPDLQILGSTGWKKVEIRTEWGQGDRNLLIQSRASITAWTRLEPHVRTEDLQKGLRLGTEARIEDAAWTLGRQWQMFEFQGEDAGSPVSVRVDGSSSRLGPWRPPTGGDIQLTGRSPLETVVERERVLPPLGETTFALTDLRLSAELGFHFLRHLATRVREHKLDRYRRWFLDEYSIAPPDEAELDAASRRFAAVASGRAPDGARIYQSFQTVLTNPPRLPKRSPFGGDDRDEAIAAIRDWYAWAERLFSQPPGDQSSAWQPQRMEYGFGVTAGDAQLEAPGFDGGHLDWYSFTRTRDNANGQKADPFTRTVLPALVTYPGMPAARWWEIENAAVDFGAVAVGASELLTLLFVEFGLAYGNDWFAVPIEALPAGSLCAVSRVTVTDSFGRTVELSPFSKRAGSDWRMFELTTAGTVDAGETLMLPDALPATLASRPIEEVLLLRDELANLAWAVERVVEGPIGRPLDRHEEEQDRRRRAEQANGGGVPPAGQQSALRYRLQVPPPSNWYPLVPREDSDEDDDVVARWLTRAALRNSEGGELIEPTGQLLEPGRPLDLFDEEVPRSGVRVVREWQLGRAPDGSTHLWRARRKGPGRGEGSSGLRFDTIDHG